MDSRAITSLAVNFTAVMIFSILMAFGHWIIAIIVFIILELLALAIA